MNNCVKPSHIFKLGVNKKTVEGKWSKPLRLREKDISYIFYDIETMQVKDDIMKPILICFSMVNKKEKVHLEGNFFGENCVLKFIELLETLY